MCIYTILFYCILNDSAIQATSLKKRKKYCNFQKQKLNCVIAMFLCIENNLRHIKIFYI